MLVTLHLILLPIAFVSGALVGSFANVCIYRIPWEKSVIWPPSCCPSCLAFVAPADNVPVISWLRLKRHCRSCGAPITHRYAGIELLVALLFVAVYVVDVASEPELIRERVLGLMLARAAYHAALVTLLVVATFIDYDYQIIPDSVTVTGMVVGLAVGALEPGIRPEPASAATALGGLWVGAQGLLIGGAVIYAVRILGWFLTRFRAEAMGLGDVTLVAMIGAFLGWQVVPPVLFLGALLGLVHGVARVIRNLRSDAADHGPESRAIPFGPYLSLAAVLWMLSWRWSWSGWLAGVYETYGAVFRFLWDQAVQGG